MTKPHGHRKDWLVREHDAFGKMLNCSRAKLITFDMVKYQQTCSHLVKKWKKNLFFTDKEEMPNHILSFSQIYIHMYLLFPIYSLSHRIIESGRFQYNPRSLGKIPMQKPVPLSLHQTSVLYRCKNKDFVTSWPQRITNRTVLIEYGKKSYQLQIVCQSESQPHDLLTESFYTSNRTPYLLHFDD